MRLFLLCLFCLPLIGAAAPADEEPEIVIEIVGEPDPVSEGISVWKKDAGQLEKFFKGKTREECAGAERAENRCSGSQNGAGRPD